MGDFQMFFGGKELKFGVFKRKRTEFRHFQRVKGQNFGIFQKKSVILVFSRKKGQDLAILKGKITAHRYFQREKSRTLPFSQGKA